MSVTNVQLHALVQDFYESQDVAERTLGYILIRQVDHLEGQDLSLRLKEVMRALQAACTKFSREQSIIEQ